MGEPAESRWAEHPDRMLSALAIERLREHQDRQQRATRIMAELMAEGVPPLQAALEAHRRTRPESVGVGCVDPSEEVVMDEKGTGELEYVSPWALLRAWWPWRTSWLLIVAVLWTLVALLLAWWLPLGVTVLLCAAGLALLLCWEARR
jgi:hypothetical protein